jgi:hypothetical protein
MTLLAMPLAGNFPKPQSRPGLREAAKRINAPLDPPAFAPGRGAPDPARLEDEAAELARLSADIPAQIQKVNHRLLPKDLNDQLKRIEKLAKHLRSEVRP